MLIHDTLAIEPTPINRITSDKPFEIFDNYIETVTNDQYDENEYLIYKIVFPNGKHYIGCTTNLNERKRQHRKDASVDQPKYIVHKALKKHNMINTFELTVIDDTANSIQEMYEKEKFYIQQYNSHIKNKKGWGCRAQQAL